MNLEIDVYQDGENDPVGLDEVQSAWQVVWNRYYADYARLSFNDSKNVKVAAIRNELPSKLKEIALIRNPDVYFVEATSGTELGGIEITTHSPDGSNVEKRYPYLWISRRQGVSAFVACPYSKTRGSGALNRLPHRHSLRNLAFLDGWKPQQDRDGGSVFQIVPVTELQGNSIGKVNRTIRELMLSWSDLGEFFAHTLAAAVFYGEQQTHAKNELSAFRTRLAALGQACVDDTRNTDAASLIKLPRRRWVQVYNSRPDSGHWERGEGQFDSIDGRLMFTLDEISLLPPDQRPTSFEFWLPQMVSDHPWITEQIGRGHGSKRFRNIVEVLKAECTTKYANDLTADDWRVLEDNRGLLIEREDWEPNIYKVIDLVRPADRARVAGVGLKSASPNLIADIFGELNRPNLYFSTHRAYRAGWREDLLRKLNDIDEGSIILIPRVPDGLLAVRDPRWIIVSAEACSKTRLLMLRQLHRSGYWKNN